MRLFIAVLFDEKTVDRLAALRDALHDCCSGAGSFVPRENLHLTLEFLGECSPAERDRVISVMEEMSFAPFPVVMDRIGFFARPDGDIWWAGAEESEQLMKLQRDLHRALLDEGFHLEKRRYRPHITLGRRVVTTMRSGRIEPIEGSIESVSLMLSERIGGRMAYTPLFSSVPYREGE